MRLQVAECQQYVMRPGSFHGGYCMTCSCATAWLDYSVCSGMCPPTGGGYVGVRRVVRLLEHGDFAKRQVDAAIDANAAMLNLRVCIMRWAKAFGAGVLDANVCGATRVWGTCSTSGQCPQRGGLAWPVGIMQEECILVVLGQTQLVLWECSYQPPASALTYQLLFVGFCKPKHSHQHHKSEVASRHSAFTRGSAHSECQTQPSTQLINCFVPACAGSASPSTATSTTRVKWPPATQPSPVAAPTLSATAC